MPPDVFVSIDVLRWINIDKKFLRLAPRPGKVYKKAAAKTARRKKRVIGRLSGPGIVRIEGGASDKIAIKRAQGEFVIEALNAQRTPSPSRKKQGMLSHK